MQAPQTSNQTKQSEYTSKTIYRNGEEITIIEQKQQPQFYGAIEI
jgi:hypothetical protein